MLLHLLATDVRRFRLAIVAWLCLEAVVTALQVFLPSFQGKLAMNAAAGFLSLAVQILAILLVVLVVQAHPLVGTDAFWLTRPIPKPTLLGSKLTLLGTLMIGVPVLCELARMAVDHVPARELLLVAAQTTLFDALWLALVMAGAVVTSSFASFATLTGGAIAAVALWIAVSLADSAIRPSDSPPTSVGPAPPEDHTGFVIFLVLMTIGALVPVLVQYRTRSRTLAGAAGVVAVASAFTIPSLLPWTFLKPRLLVPEWTERESALRLTADAKTVDFGNRIWRSSTARVWRTGRVTLWLNGVEPGWSATVGLLDASIRLDAGETLDNGAGAHAAAVPFEGTTDHQEKTVLRRLLDVQHLPALNLPEGEQATVFVVPEGDFLKHASATGTYQGRFRVNLTREEIAGIFPLRPGVVLQEGAHRFAIEDVFKPTMNTVRIRAREADATSLFDRRETSLYRYYLRNARTSEAIAGNEWEMPSALMLFSGLTTDSSIWPGFSARGITIQFPGHTPRGESFTITRSWLDQSELVIVRLTREGSVERSLSFSLVLDADGTREAASTGSKTTK